MIFVIRKLYMILVLHFFGDYILQPDFIAKTKGSNWWHLIVHCFVYSFPFAFYFGSDWRLIVVLVTHFIIDMLTHRFGIVDKICDQLLHLIVLTMYLYVI